MSKIAVWLGGGWGGAGGVSGVIMGGDDHKLPITIKMGIFSAIKPISYLLTGEFSSIFPKLLFPLEDTGLSGQKKRIPSETTLSSLTARVYLSVNLLKTRSPFKPLSPLA